MASPTYCRSLREVSQAIYAPSQSLLFQNLSPELVVISGFFPAVVARKMKAQLDQLLSQNGSSIYGSSATPLYEYRESANRPIKRYLDEAEDLWRKHAAILADFGNPVQVFMDGLAEASGAPVKRLEIQGQPCFFGQYRCFDPYADILPHVDVLEREFPAVFSEVTQQWAVNFALCCPEAGGELQIWNSWPSPEEYIEYGYERPEKEPKIHYRPSPGDLYLFRSGFLHSVSHTNGPRCALAGFVAGPWPDGGLRVWS